MSGTAETALRIGEQIEHLVAADEQFVDAQSETIAATQDSETAWNALGIARKGIHLYSQATVEALNAGEEADNKLKLAGSILQDPVASPRRSSAEEHIKAANDLLQFADERRDKAIAAGTIAVDGLHTAKNGIVGFLTHLDRAQEKTNETTSKLNSAMSIEGTPPVAKEMEKAEVAIDSYATTLHRASADAKGYLGRSGGASHTDMVSSLFAEASQKLEEGVAHLEESKNKPVEEFLAAARAALQKVDREFSDLLADLRISTGLSAKVLPEAAREASVSSIIQSAIQQNKTLLTGL